MKAKLKYYCLLARTDRSISKAALRAMRFWLQNNELVQRPSMASSDEEDVYQEYSALFENAGEYV